MDRAGKTFTCPICGSLFFRWNSEIRKNKSGIFFCSANCRNMGWIGEGNPNYGNNWTDEQKNNVSEKKRGTPAWNKGLTKYDHPSVMKYAKQLQRENNPSWKGGISFGEYCPKFNTPLKEYIRDKYNRKCIICGKDESECKTRLHIHHADYNKNTLCNGKTWGLLPLCNSCHNKTNHNRYYWYNLLYNHWCYKYISWMEIYVL